MSKAKNNKNFIILKKFIKIKRNVRLGEKIENIYK
jgi:hypothetical protein